jgi:hypothetical protein
MRRLSDTRLPKLVYTSTGSGAVTLLPSNRRICRLTLSNGKQYTIGPSGVVVACSVRGYGGYDTTSTPASSKVHYIYAVANPSSPGSLTGVFSATAPPTGPAYQYSTTGWIYVGSVYIGSTGLFTRSVYAGAWSSLGMNSGITLKQINGVALTSVGIVGSNYYYNTEVITSYLPTTAGIVWTRSTGGYGPTTRASFGSVISGTTSPGPVDDTNYPDAVGQSSFYTSANGRSDMIPACGTANRLWQWTNSYTLSYKHYYNVGYRAHIDRFLRG